MRFVTQFIETAPTVNSPVQTSNNVVSPSTFDRLVEQPRYNDYTAASYGNFVRNSTSASRWVMRNRDKFKYVVARGSMRINPWVIGAEFVAGVAVGFYVRSKPAVYDTTGYTLMRDCGRGYTYATTDAGAQCFFAELPVSDAAINRFNNPRPANWYTWLYLRPRPVVPGTHYAAPDKWYQRTVTAGPPVYTPASNSGWLPDPFADTSPGSFTMPEVVIGLREVPRPWGDTTPDPHLDGDPKGQPSTKPQPQPERPGKPGPPPKNTKEKKMRIQLPFVNAGKHNLQSFGHLTTEGLDALECLWKALPKSVRTKPTHRLGEMPGAQAFNPDALVTSPQEKMNDVWRNWNKIDWSGRRNPDGSLVSAREPGALTCLALNHVTDEIIGRVAGGAQSEATKRQIILGLLG